MKLGQIKLEAILLMYPDANVKFDDTDDESINRAVFELKCDSNFEGLLEATVGSINRALSQIEAHGLTCQRLINIPKEECEIISGDKVKIPLCKDFLRLQGLFYKNGNSFFDCECQVFDNCIITKSLNADYLMTYLASAQRINRKTSDSYELLLPKGVCEAIPYFVKSDLYAAENEREAQRAKEIFDGMIRDIKDSLHLVNCEIKTVYTI